MVGPFNGKSTIMVNSYIIFGGCSVNLIIPSVRDFLFAFGGNQGLFTIGAAESMSILPAPGWISDFHVEQETAPGAGEGIVWSLLRNTIPVIEVTIEDTNTQGSTTDRFHFDSESITDNMTVGVIATSGTSPALTRVRWSFKWTPDTAGYSILCAGCGNRVLDTTTRFACLAGRFDAGLGNTFPADENDARVMIPTAGTIRNLTVRLQGDPDPGNTRVFTLRKNVADTSLTVTFNGTTRFIPQRQQDSVNSVSVVAGDIINVKCTSTGTPPDTRAQVSVVFEGTNKNEYIIPLTSDNNMPRNGVDNFCSLWDGRDRYQTTNESQTSVLANRGDGLLKLKNMYVKLTAAPGVFPDRSYIFRVRKNQVTTALARTITRTATTTNVTADVVLEENDLLTMNQDSIRDGKTQPNLSKAAVACTAEFIANTVNIRGGNILGAKIAV